MWLAWVCGESQSEDILQADGAEEDCSGRVSHAPEEVHGWFAPFVGPTLHFPPSSFLAPAQVLDAVEVDSQSTQSSISGSQVQVEVHGSSSTNSHGALCLEILGSPTCMYCVGHVKCMLHVVYRSAETSPH